MGRSRALEVYPPQPTYPRTHQHFAIESRSLNGTSGRGLILVNLPSHSVMSSDKPSSMALESEKIISNVEFCCPEQALTPCCLSIICCSMYDEPAIGIDEDLANIFPNLWFSTGEAMVIVVIDSLGEYNPPVLQLKRSARRGSQCIGCPQGHPMDCHCGDHTI